jgi:hypothetical membrane protein
MQTFYMESSEKNAMGKRVLGALPYLGIFGSALVSLSVLGGALAYTGAQGEPYSILNHFISEIGRVGISRAALLFNASMVIAGVLFMPFCAGISMRLRTVPGWLAFAAGVSASVACAGVGLFPMNNLRPHIAFAMWFFRLGLAVVLLYAIAILVQPRRALRLPRSASLASLPAILAYSAFLFLAGMSGVGDQSPFDPGTFANRPAFWPIALLEWLVFFTTIAWFFLMAIIQLRSNRKQSE